MHLPELGAPFAQDPGEEFASSVGLRCRISSGACFPLTWLWYFLWPHTPSSIWKVYRWQLSISTISVLICTLWFYSTSVFVLLDNFGVSSIWWLSSAQISYWVILFGFCTQNGASPDVQNGITEGKGQPEHDQSTRCGITHGRIRGFAENTLWF